MADAIDICGYRPGAIGRIAELHGRYYHQNWGFDQRFEAEVATELAHFVTRMDRERDGMWLAVRHDRIVGSVAIDGSGEPTEGARLRWFILDDGCRGEGVGELLMCAALAFCRDVGFRRVYLWTFNGLEAARHLYEKHGFVLREEQGDDGWGRHVTHQLFELLL